MRSSRPRMFLALPLLISVFALALSACGAGNADATPTLSVDAIYTMAYQTLTAQRATELALTPPTPTPTDTPAPTLPPPPTFPSNLTFATPTTAVISGGAPGCNSAVYVKDVTIPDGTLIDPGKKFVKTWQLMNNGSCAWDPTYKLVFQSGDALGGTSVPLPSSVPAGALINISVSLGAPSDAGKYSGSWQMEDPQGNPFGNVITVVIKVGTVQATDTPGSSTATPTPTPT